MVWHARIFSFDSSPCAPVDLAMASSIQPACVKAVYSSTRSASSFSTESSSCSYAATAAEYVRAKTVHIFFIETAYWQDERSNVPWSESHDARFAARSFA